MNTRADRLSRVVDSDWIVVSVLRMISGAVFHILGICDGGAPSEKNDWHQREKCKFNEDWKRDFAWIAKLPDCGMAQCNRCAIDFSISSGGRTDVHRHQESVRHARLGSTKGGMGQYIAHGQNEADSVTNMYRI